MSREKWPGEITLNCHRCFAAIIVVGPKAKIGEALRRVDWDLTGNTVTCPRCLKKPTGGKP